MRPAQIVFWTLFGLALLAIVADAAALVVFGNIVMFARLASGGYP